LILRIKGWVLSRLFPILGSSGRERILKSDQQKWGGETWSSTSGKYLRKERILL
jgi:hypothetical protein